MIVQLPEGEILVVDAKASASRYDASVPSLRPLIEYTNRQRERQRGGSAVFGALVVAGAFEQDAAGLAEVSSRFYAEAGVPVSFMSIGAMDCMVSELRDKPTIRNSLRWRQVFRGGLVSEREIKRELSDAESESIRSGRP